MKRLGRTPPFQAATGETLPGSIAEIAYVSLGGLDQWVMIRGESIANPILILVHGGPGFPEARLFRHFNWTLEKIFTVVYWDQRGTNKSFDHRIPASSMTIDQFIADLDGLVDAVCRRFGHRTVAIYGHSWGSALGVLYAARSPQKVATFVGTGQIGSWPASEAASYAFVLAEAERRNNRRAVKELRAIGAPPYTAAAKMVQGKWLGFFFGFVRGMPSWRFVQLALSGPEASPFDLPALWRGMKFSQNTMWGHVSSLDLTTAVPALQMPVFFFLGRHDHVIDANTSANYFKVLAAPEKKLVWFEHSAHEPPWEEPEKFNRAMAELVHPLAVGAESRAC